MVEEWEGRNGVVGVVRTSPQKGPDAVVAVHAEWEHHGVGFLIAKEEQAEAEKERGSKKQEARSGMF